jgi:hypothetical protein
MIVLLPCCTAPACRVQADKLVLRLQDVIPIPMAHAQQVLLAKYSLRVTLTTTNWVPPVPPEPLLTVTEIGIVAAFGFVFVVAMFFLLKWVWFKYIYKPKAVTPSEAVLRDTSAFLKRAQRAGGECAWTGE